MKKEITIIVNGREKTVEKNTELSFSNVVALAFDGTPGENTMFTVTYRKGQGNKPEGTLVEGDIVKVKEGMVFHVSETGQS